MTDPERFWDHFPGEDAAGDLRLRDGGARWKAATGGRALLRRAPRRPHAERARTTCWASTRADHRSDGVAARGDLLQHAALLRRARPLRRAALHCIPGRVMPVMRPKSDGKAGHAKITFTGFAASRPSVTVSIAIAAAATGKLRLDIPRVAVSRPSALAALVRDGREGLERLELRVKVDTAQDERDALIAREREEQVDAQIMSAEQVTALVGHLERLRAAGLYRDALAYHDVGDAADRGRLAARGGSGDRTRCDAAGQRRGRRRSRISGHCCPPAIATQADRSCSGTRPIPPPEAYDLLAKMSTFKRSDGLQGRAQLSGQGHLGDGLDAARRGVATGRRRRRRRSSRRSCTRPGSMPTRCRRPATS